jgi:hypothetical protein
VAIGICLGILSLWEHRRAEIDPVESIGRGVKMVAT